MKNNKWVWWILTILLTLVVLVGVGGAGYRMGLMQSVNTARNTDGTFPNFGNMHSFNGDFKDQARNPHMQMRGFDHGRRRGGFSLLFSFVRLAVLGLLLWAGYKLYRKSGWQFVKVNSPAQSEAATVDEKKDEFIRRLDLSLLLIAIGTLMVAFIFGAILSRTITRPIRELTKATHEMAGGKFGQRVPVRSQDEIGELASSFNKMNDDLGRSFNLRKQMTADIAHELRTPLSLIIGHAEAVHDGVLPPTKENFEIIREEAERLEQLVNDLRILSLADAGELSVDFQPVDVNKLLGDIQTHYMTPFNQKRITLNLQSAPGILTANLDPVRFSQVLTNILDNALRYTPENGRVVMAVKQNVDQVEISIQDSGEGVTSEEAAHLFDRFYRADASRTRDEGGSGLGLAIAKSIAEMHKGKIWAESEKGKGLKVIIQVPILK